MKYSFDYADREWRQGGGNLLKTDKTVHCFIALKFISIEFWPNEQQKYAINFFLVFYSPCALEDGYITC